jgi:hypothetical protein
MIYSAGMTFHLAELNVARMNAPLDDPSMADFAAGLHPLNALADASPGFVWRLIEEGGADSTGLRPFGPDMLVNLSVWEDVESLRAYTYQTRDHLEAVRRRREWFHHEGVGEHLVLWWIPAGTLPTLAEAGERRDLLNGSGPTPEAFTLRRPFPAPRAVEVR